MPAIIRQSNLTFGVLTMPARAVFPPLFIAERSARLTAQLKSLFEQEGFPVVGHAATAAAAIHGILKTMPRAVILDLALEQGSGLDVIKRIHPNYPWIDFVAVCGHEPQQVYAERALALGARHYFDKYLQLPEAVEAVRAMRLGA
jgi:DNA-binding NarL/FixJ family response regulator